MTVQALGKVAEGHAAAAVPDLAFLDINAKSLMSFPRQDVHQEAIAAAKVNEGLVGRQAFPLPLLLPQKDQAQRANATEMSTEGHTQHSLCPHLYLNFLNPVNDLLHPLWISFVRVLGEALQGSTRTPSASSSHFSPCVNIEKVLSPSTMSDAGEE
ncbi:hypothetical protein GWK47_006786 [Chionoecetes opilio]|uniref:Uncharacterized protein n=1 Tax=Chionoecetes opilio TaxID=41210 RepID=A0A8J4Y4J0_CHIOP|nr:hypothetical protein GWK47_006786 [Chionoecetes opilio]